MFLVAVINLVIIMDSAHTLSRSRQRHEECAPTGAETILEASRPMEAYGVSPRSGSMATAVTLYSGHFDCGST